MENNAYFLPTITDPVFIKREQYNFFDRIFLDYINDERDLPFVYLCLQIILWIIPMTVLLYSPVLGGWKWGVAAMAHVLVVLGYFAGPYTSMLHHTIHRRFFKRAYDWGNYIVPWVIGPFVGQTPETYHSHHLGMHHVENNSPDDRSNTLCYQRDSIIDFLKYFYVFFFTGVLELIKYLRTRNRYDFIRNALRGEVGFLIVCSLLVYVNWQATLVVFIIPFVFIRFAMMVANWSQHAFVDVEDYTNVYRSSMTTINGLNNRRCFNEGYHIGHHLRPHMHWTDMPAYFLKNMERYGNQRAVVFDGIDYIFVWVLLMLKKYDRLAKYFVNINNIYGSQEDIITLLKNRTRKIPKMTWHDSEQKSMPIFNPL